MKKSYTVKDLPQEERPRERLVKYGSEALSGQELLALILGRGVHGESVMNISQKILSKFGSLSSLKDTSIEDFKEIKGVGLAKAAQIQACVEIARRINHYSNKHILNEKKQQVLSSKDVYQLVKSKIKNYSKEHFVVLSFDTKNKLIGSDIVAVGTLNANIVHPRETFEVAIRHHAAKIIIAHNHPSGDTEPSNEDLEITRQMVEAGKIMGINVVDHLIIGEGYKSII